MKEGSLYVEGGKVWQLQTMKEKSASFLHTPLFGAPEAKDVDHKDLKNFRAWNKPSPALQDLALCKSLQPCNSLADEHLRAKALCLLHEKIAEPLGCIFASSIRGLFERVWSCWFLVLF